MTACLTRSICLLLIAHLLSEAAQAKILVPMDLDQTDHLKAYGLVHQSLERGRTVEWVLNYRGGAFLLEEEPATYFLTDFLVRHWETTVAAELGLDRRPELAGTLLGGFHRLIWLRQAADAGLEARARRIAATLDLPLEIRDVGDGALPERLRSAVED